VRVAEPWGLRGIARVLSGGTQAARELTHLASWRSCVHERRREPRRPCPRRRRLATPTPSAAVICARCHRLAWPHRTGANKEGSHAGPMRWRGSQAKLVFLAPLLSPWPSQPDIRGSGSGAVRRGAVWLAHSWSCSWSRSGSPTKRPGPQIGP
jgi:hypothetical protein